MLRRSAPFLLVASVPAFFAFVGCGSDSSTFEPEESSSSSGEPPASSGVISSGGGNGGSSGRPAEPGCGNAFLEEGEVCDDSNKNAGDGCSADCKTIEAGFQCISGEGQACVAICGDGLLLGDEDCDDGNASDGEPPAGDGCSAGCRLQPGWKCTAANVACEPTVCGDGNVEGTEQCDDLATADAPDRPYDGCFHCVKEPECGNNGCVGACGDGLLFPNEQCDDGNTRDGDGCSATCTPEPGFECANRTEDPPGELALPVLYRDFLSPWNAAPDATPVLKTEAMNPAGHPDFENFIGYGIYRDLVTATLGSDKAPVFNQDTATPNPCITSQFLADGVTPNPAYAVNCAARKQLTGQTEFNEWYHDGARSKLVLSTLRLPRQGDSDSYVFDSNVAPYQGYHFFPLDPGNPENTGTGYGEQDGRVCRDPFIADTTKHRPIFCYGTAGSTKDGSDDEVHNFFFTTELRFWFTYQEAANDTDGPVLEFTGDDDVWIYVNGRRVIDLGGLHDPRGDSFQLTRAKGTELGLQNGNVYEIALFHAERHTNASNFKFTLRGFEKKRTFCEPKCGDGVKTKNETCDDGTLAGGYNQCAEGCVWGPRCGDGITQGEFGEECDDGNFKEQDGCRPDCIKGDTIN